MTFAIRPALAWATAIGCSVALALVLDRFAVPAAFLVGPMLTGIDVVGPLPPELQLYTVFSAGVVTGSREPEAARSLVRFLNAPVADDIRASGMEPMATAAPTMPAAE